MAVVQDERHEGSQTRTKVLQVDDGSDGRDGEGVTGREALGTGCGGWGVGMSIKKTSRTSRIIPGSWPGNGENGEKAGLAASHGSFDGQAETFASPSEQRGPLKV